MFACTKCEKTFTCNRYLTKHNDRIHKVEKAKKELPSIRCTMCGKEFPRLSHLQRHQLTHYSEDMREWGCPFCLLRFVQRPHLTRHIVRKHGEESVVDLEKKISQHRWRDGEPSSGSSTPLPAVKREEMLSLPSTSTQNDTNNTVKNANLLPRYLCSKCGHSYCTADELKRHFDVKHVALTCSDCSRTIFGRKAYKRHQMLERGEKFQCNCGVSFQRKADLRRHQNACFGRASFCCVECGQAFVQRVQLDRHYRRVHFKNDICAICDWRTLNPIQMAEHMLQQHHVTVCGFCGVVNPEEDHISNQHWKKLNTPIRRRKRDIAGVVSQIVAVAQQIEHENGDDSDVAEHSSDDDEMESESTLAHDVEVNCGERHVDPLQRMLDFSDSLLNDQVYGALHDDEEIALQSHEKTTEKEMTSMSNDALTTNEIRYVHIIASVPDEVNMVPLGSRLPSEVVQLFPELAESKVLFLDEFDMTERHISIHVPVTVQPEKLSPDASQWLSTTIYI